MRPSRKMPFPRNVPTAVVELDKPRTIALTLDALNRLEELTGQPIMQIGLDSDNIVKKLDIWIWASLGDEDRAEISASEIRQMIHLGNIARIATAVSSLITDSLPDAKEGKTEPAPPSAQMVEAGIS